MFLVVMGGMPVPVYIDKSEVYSACIACARPVAIEAEKASLASEGKNFEARREAVVKRAVLRDGLVLLQAGRRH
jgi:hypothetical protein